MNDYDDFRDRWHTQQQKLHVTPRDVRQPAPLPPPMTSAQLRAQRRQYGKAINRRPPKYEPVPHEVKVLWTALLYFAGVIVLVVVLSLLVR